VSTSNNIPFLDLVTPHVELEPELLQVFSHVLHTAGFVGGPIVENFEKEFAEFCATNHAVAVNSGTDALRFALMAAGVKPGDAVVTVPHTFIATTEAISQAGGRPEFVDIDSRTYNMDPEKLREYLEQGCVRDAAGKLASRRSGRPVTAVVPVHLYGQMADMDAIQELAERFSLIVIEDACQAHGAEYFSRKHDRWFKAGSMGQAAAFSFYPGKNLGACGEGGAITTNQTTIAQKSRMLRDHGQAKKYYHDLEGYNGRLDAIQCGILSVKLAHLDRWNKSRQQSAGKYNEEFTASAANVVTPFEPESSRAVYHLYVVQVDDREALQASLANAGIGTGIHYPVPLHQQKAYAHLGYKTGDFPVTERLARRIVSLPIFPHMTNEQVVRVANEVTESISRALQTVGALAR
jgi:dTDP-4-amino-4,6-dideoxygalactose transaminase